MVSDGLSWCTIIFCPYRRNKNKDYIVERIQVQPRFFQVLRDLPACTGVGVRRDLVGTVLNKTVSTGDDPLGQPWADLPPNLQVYGIGGIHFG